MLLDTEHLITFFHFRIVASTSDGKILFKKTKKLKVVKAVGQFSTVAFTVGTSEVDKNRAAPLINRQYNTKKK